MIGQESSSFVHGRVMYSMRYWDSVQRKTNTNHGQNIEATNGILYRWVMVEKISNCIGIDRCPFSTTVENRHFCGKKDIIQGILQIPMTLNSNVMVCNGIDLNDADVKLQCCCSMSDEEYIQNPISCKLVK